MKIILVGKGAAGKDYLKNRLAGKGFIASVSCTTRPPRPNEVEGVDYFFIDRDSFMSIVDSGEMLEWMEFNGWLYGMTKEEFEKSDIMIMSKDGLSMLPKKYRDQCIVIYLDISRLCRVSRLANRNDKNDTVWRRLETDEEQFKNFKDYDIRIKNDDF